MKNLELGFGCRCAPSYCVNSMAPMLMRPVASLGGSVLSVTLSTFSGTFETVHRSLLLTFFLTSLSHLNKYHELVFD